MDDAIVILDRIDENARALSFEEGLAGGREGSWECNGLESIDVREGDSGASADAPGVGLEIVSGLKLLQKDENKLKKSKKKMKKCQFSTILSSLRSKTSLNQDEKDDK